MVSADDRGRFGRMRACALVLGLLAAGSPAQAANPTAIPAADKQQIDQENTRVLAQAVGADEETPETRRLAERPDIQVAFAQYKLAGGLAPKFRFAHAYALTSGFTGGPLAGMIEDPTPQKEADLLRTHPAAFDLVCRPTNGDKTPRTPGEAVPVVPTSLRFSVDVAAGLWRADKAYVQRVFVGAHGKLFANWRVDLEHATWGTPRYDRISRAYDESIATTSLTSKKVSRVDVHATCELAPYSKLFGARND